MPDISSDKLPLALKVAALEQARIASDIRITERAEAVEKLANTIAAATTAENKSTANLLETKLSGVDKTLGDSIEAHGKALDLQAKEYERRFGILDKGLDNSVSSNVFTEVEKQRRDDNYNLRQWRDGVDRELNTQRGRNSGWTAAGALLFSILSFLLGLWAVYLSTGPHHQ